MDDERYKMIDDTGTGLTKEESDQGWHFCSDFDGMLVGPVVDSEAEYCTCNPIIQEWKKLYTKKEII